MRCSLPPGSLLEVRSEAVLAEPELHEVGHAAAGERRARQAVDPVRVFVRRTGRALDDLDRRPPVLVEGLAPRPERLPARVVDFAAEPRRLAVLVEGDADDRRRVRRQRQKAVERRPQALALDRQDDQLDRAVLDPLVDQRLVRADASTRRCSPAPRWLSAGSLVALRWS